MRKLACIAAVLTVLGVGMVATAVAGIHSPTSIELNKGKTKVKGQIEADKKRCEKNRVVELFEKKKSSSSYESIDETSSENDGKWVTKLAAKAKKGNLYYVKVHREGACSASTSDKIQA